MAARQLGTSGGGNHFAEFTKLSVYAENPLDLEPGRYISLVTHSGSAGFGSAVGGIFAGSGADGCGEGEEFGEAVV